jgi:hypothetical protein
MSRANEPIHPTMMCTGLSIREHFAAMAMQGMLANSVLPRYAASVPRAQFLREIAVDAIGHADALIAELSKPSNDGSAK